MESNIKRILEPRLVPLVSDLSVRRVLPRGGRGVGPFLFLDHFGPWEYRPDKQAVDIGPHPHIGLSAVTFLFEGELVHRDSLGTVQEVRPGDVNWMTAGSGIVHSERTPAALRGKQHRVHGLQAWVALPESVESLPPSFAHHEKQSLPKFSLNGVSLCLIAGSAFGKKSPVKTHSRLFYLECQSAAANYLEFDSEGQEVGFYLLEGAVSIEGKEFSKPTLFIFKDGSRLHIEFRAGARGVLLGGDSCGPRQMWWNFVSSSLKTIEKAKQDWKENRFPSIPGEVDSIPLPD